MTSTARDGTRMSMMRASRGSIVNMMAMAPRIVSTDSTTSSGPWWASSAISFKSVVTRDISFPVRFTS